MSYVITITDKLHTLIKLSSKDKEKEEVEDEIEAHGELRELKELLVDCTTELLKRPALLREEIAPTTKGPIQ